MKKILHSVPTISKEDISAVQEVLSSKHLEEGEYVRQFEYNMSHYIGRKFAAATTNGFSAIHLALIALGVQENDEVIIPSYTCPAVLNPILLLRAIPIIVDIENAGFNICLQRIKDNLSVKTKAIIVPHMFGFPAEIDEITKFGIPVIEDCAQAIGGTLKSKILGSFSEVSIFSFYSSKMICTGDGGMVLTDDRKIYERIINYRYYGHKKLHPYPAYNYHMTNLPAALGISQLKKIDLFIEKRKEIAKIYDEYFGRHPKIRINFKNKADSIFFRYPIEIEQRDLIKSKLTAKEIYTGYGVLDGLHQMVQKNKEYVNTEKYLKNILSIPIYPSLTIANAKKIAEEIINLKDTK